jgi:hypothetical protein
MFVCKHKTGIPGRIKKRECLPANTLIMSAVNFPDFWDNFRRQFRKNSLGSDALYAFFNKSLVSVISN